MKQCYFFCIDQHNSGRFSKQTKSKFKFSNWSNKIMWQVLWFELEFIALFLSLFHSFVRCWRHFALHFSKSFFFSKKMFTQNHEYLTACAAGINQYKKKISEILMNFYDCSSHEFFSVHVKLSCFFHKYNKRYGTRTNWLILWTITRTRIMAVWRNKLKLQIFYIHIQYFMSKFSSLFHNHRQSLSFVL